MRFKTFNELIAWELSQETKTDAPRRNASSGGKELRGFVLRKLRYISASASRGTVSSQQEA